MPHQRQQCDGGVGTLLDAVARQNHDGVLVGLLGALCVFFLVLYGVVGDGADIEEHCIRAWSRCLGGLFIHGRRFTEVTWRKPNVWWMGCMHSSCQFHSISCAALISSS